MVVYMMHFNAPAINASGALSTEAILGVQIVIWSGLEMNIAFACGSVPAVKPLLSLLFPSLNFKTRHYAKQRAQKLVRDSQNQDSPSHPSSAKSLYPLNSLRKYGQSLDDSLSRTTRNDMELELIQAQNAIIVERSVEQGTELGTVEDYNRRFPGLPAWDTECGRTL
ncbi:hypothetical protein M406DRAFT_332507 [Cryphonectria parasitica EP155]|uniref:Uncharacterized protein n=1 Tax=Cryphonectria parasitica (strain ATCC 38755 / EP155) TaxID=660469 RepID=A0A9P4XVL4_CRYP1|nr:uncharacterized protein M406DRAFT_332507 [Cryphonectria parasitica EP155]KAF3762112.1 hypothetical protein M406DRAFT_332507 [Cryphonectria parasitica EP155]